MIRVMVLVAAVLGLGRLRGAGDYRYAPLALATGVSTAVAYLGGYLPVSWPIDPYFFAVFGSFAATIPAAWLVADVEWRGLLRSRGSKAVIIVAAVVAIPRLARTLGTYIPELLPKRVVRSTIDVMIAPLVGVKEPLPDRLRHEASPPSFAVVAAWFAEHHGGRGSILVDDAALAAYLSVSASLPIVGPLGERGSVGAAADPTRLFSEPMPPERVARVLDHCAVGWVALWGAPSRFDLDAELPLLEPVIRVAGVRIRRVSREPSFVAEGEARIGSLDFDRLRVVSGALGSNDGSRRLVLRFAYDRRLKCRPNCGVTPVRVTTSFGEVDFVSIDHPPPEFVLATAGLGP
jgi:hypothetical protein